MGSSTSWYLAGFLLFICSGTLVHTEFSNTVPECSVSWQVDWNVVPDVGSELFQTSGEIVDGVAVRDVLAFLGLAWDAPSWQEIVGLACVRYGPLLNEEAGDDTVRRECEVILRSLRTGRRMRIKDDCIRASNETGVSAYLTTPLDFYQTGETNLDDLETVTNLSPIAFELLEWLTPSPFSGDFHGACSALRLMLSMPVEDIIERLKNICVYPMAIILESLSDQGICADPEPGSGTAFGVDILDVLAGSSVPETCQFFSSNLTHERFVERAIPIVDNAVAFLTDRGICDGILSTMAEYFGNDTDYAMPFNLITGATLGSTSSREMLCRNIADAFDPDSSFVPEPYVLPDGTRLEDFLFEDVPGEILPNYFFEDCLNVAGAFRRADTIAGGIVVFCDVFETVAVAESPENARDVEQMCDSLRALNLVTVEDMCLDLLFQTTGSIYTGVYAVPLSVRIITPFYAGAIGLEFYRKLFDPTRISVEDICDAQDSFFNSDNNLQSVIRLAVDVWLAELIPMAHRICEDYDAVYDYFNATFWGQPSFPIVEKRITALILAHLGFESREDVCMVIAEGIESSGRATDGVVERFQEELLAFLTNEQRCVASADAVLSGVELSDVDDVDALFRTYTGYNSKSAACGELREFFTAELCDTSDGDDGGNVVDGDGDDTGDGSMILRSHPALLLAIFVQTILLMMANVN